MPTQLGFRFGVGPAGILGGAAPDWRQTVARIERLGYSTLCVGDHLSMMGPLPALAAAAAWTERIGLGSAVAGNDYRSPLLLAQDAATVQALSGGRLELGIGAGWDRADYRQLGLEFESPGRRIERLGEAVTIVKRYLAGGAFSFHGDHYELDEVVPLPVPLPRQPRIMIGGGGPRILSLAAREADVVGINVPLRGADVRQSIAAGDTAGDRVAAAVETIRAAAGERFAELELHLNLLYCHVTDDPEPRLEAAARGLGLAVEEVAESPFVLIGEEAEIEAKLLRVRERLGITYFTLDLAAAEQMAPIVARLAGR